MTAPAVTSLSNDRSFIAVPENLIDRSTIVWWLVLAATVILTVYVSRWAVLLPIVIVMIEDVAFFFGYRLLFDPKLRIRRNYQWCHNMFADATGQGRDLAFSLVTKDGGLSLKAKYQHVAGFLGLKSGMKIIDLGCGYGDWLKYCRDEIGCEVVGVNISPEQAEFARSVYGLEVYTHSWDEILRSEALQKRLYGKFDAVTAMDTMEHWVTMEHRNDPAAQNAIYASATAMMAKLLNPGSDSSRVYLSLLHQVRRKRSLKFYFWSYLMDKFYSGHYPFEDEGPAVACRPWFNVVHIEDRTEDYRLSGVMDPLNFQAIRYRWSFRQVAYVSMLFFFDPYVLHRLLFYFNDTWMKLYGNNPYDPSYDLDERLKSTWVRLLWIGMERRTSPC